MSADFRVGRLASPSVSARINLLGTATIGAKYYAGYPVFLRELGGSLDEVVADGVDRQGYAAGGLGSF